MNIIPEQFPHPDRAAQAKAKRELAAEISTEAPFPDQIQNHDEKSPYLFSFTKGLPHAYNGLLKNPADFEAFRVGTQQHHPYHFGKAPLYGGTFLTPVPANTEPLRREWESPTSGHAYVLEGLDPYALTMPPAPEIGSDEFVAEMAEVYEMALTRDFPVAAFMSPKLISGLRTIGNAAPNPGSIDGLNGYNKKAADIAKSLSKLRWFKGLRNSQDTNSGAQRDRRRFGQKQTVGNMFRGLGEDGWNTPFLSQFLVMGTAGGAGDSQLTKRATGKIQYGAQTIDQRVRVASPETDYMMKWDEWLDVQNALNKRPLVDEFPASDTRIMMILRDLATYVHDDQLYQAYLNAALILLGEGYERDPGIPYHGGTTNPAPSGNRDPFALFGGPHILTLVTEVSSRALKAVRLQKFSVHRRLRPEAAAALFHTVFTGYHPQRDLAQDKRGVAYAQNDGSPEAMARDMLSDHVAPYTHPYVNGVPTGSNPEMDKILERVRLHNNEKTGDNTWLLPMAFPEGSPMHPAYGAGHATVAGACVTLLKAFFNMRNAAGDKPAYLVKPKGKALVPAPVLDNDGTEMLVTDIKEGLTLEGELNKLIWNISNARNIAGVHYFTDYIESALLGEAITLSILREQMVGYHAEENVSITVPLLTPRTLPATLRSRGPIGPDEVVPAVRITSTGTLEPASATPGRTI